MLYTLRPANFCITFRADYGRAYDRIAWRENWGLVNRPAGMAAGGFIKRFAGAVALHHCTGYSSCYPDTQSALNIATWFVSFVFAIAMWYYTLWLTIAFFKRRKSVPKHYIIWLLVSVLLAVKAFAFSPVSDALAVRQLLFPLLATALLVPYFKRSTRVKKTFVNP